jgi:hypothetical protein
MSRRDRAAGASGRDGLPALPSTGWRLRLVPAGSDDVDPEATVQLALRCLPRVPVAAEEVEHWLEHELEELRRDLPQGTIRLSRLTQALPSADVGIGWLIELELAEAQPLPPLVQRRVCAQGPAAAGPPTDAADLPGHRRVAQPATCRQGVRLGPVRTFQRG